MLSLVWIPLLLQLAVPLALLLWLAVARQPGHAAWLLTVALVAGWILLAARAGLWLLLPTWTPAALAAILLVAASVSLRRVREQGGRPSGARSAVGVALRAVALALVAAAVAHAHAGRRPPAGEVVELAFPLRSAGPGGDWVVVNGGSVPLVNAHLATLDEARFRPWVGQSHAVDLVRLRTRGFRARGVLPRDPAAYAIFGDTVTAPCAGVVVAAEDGHADMSPPRPDRAHMAGNHVILACDGAWVLLGHLRRGSVRAAAGGQVRVGDPLGVVGNSGNSNEPHLHVHAQRPGTRDAPLGGAPLPIRLGGRYLARNDRVATPAP